MMATEEQTPPPSHAEERQAPPDVATSRDVGAGAVGELPAQLTPSQVGAACNMSRRAAKGLLIGAGIAERDEQTGRWHVSPERLRVRLPDVYARVLTAFRGPDAV